MINSKQWLTDLNKALEQTQCRVKGLGVLRDEAFAAVETVLLDAQKSGHKVWWAANGGSASIASHLSQDLLNKLKIRSLPLSDSSLITCMANDYGYENVYLRPLETLAETDDVLIAISSSGKSANIIKCAEFAKQRGLKLITLSGFTDDNPLWKMPAEASFYFPSRLYGLVEVGHTALLHAVIESLTLRTIH